MEKQVAANIAMQSLKALQDSRVMLPSDSTDAISDLKSILRGLMSGQMALVGVPKTSPVVPDDSDD